MKFFFRFSLESKPDNLPLIFPAVTPECLFCSSCQRIYSLVNLGGGERRQKKRRENVPPPPFSGDKSSLQLWLHYIQETLLSVYWIFLSPGVDIITADGMNGCGVDGTEVDLAAF